MTANKIRLYPPNPLLVKRGWVEQTLIRHNIDPTDTHSIRVQLAWMLEQFEERTSRQGRLSLLKANETGQGGFKRDFLASINVSWPPKAGWKVHFIETGLGDE